MNQNTIAYTYKDFVRGTKALLSRVQTSLLCALLIYKVITVCICLPLMQWLWSLALQLSPSEYIVTDNLKHMLSSPAILISIIIMAIATAWWTLYEFSLILCGLDNARNGKPCKLLPLLGQAAVSIRHALLPKNWLVLIMAGVMVPFTNLFFSSNAISQLAVPYYIYEVIMDKPLTAWLYRIFVIFLLYMMLRWLLAFHYFIVGKKSFKESRKASVSWVKEHTWKKLLGIVRWGIREGIVVGIVLSIAAIIAFAVLIAIGVSHENLMIALWNSIDVISKPYFLFLIDCLITILQMAYLSALYYTHTEGAPLVLDYSHKYQKKGRLLLAFISVCVLVGNLCVAGILYIIPDENRIELFSNEITVTSHRGYSAAAPENTLPAFEAAIEAGADCAELDVQMTKDGVVVLTHDTNLKRTTGVDANVYDLTYAEIKALDAGSFFGEEYAGTKIATLDEVIKLCKGKIRLNIEIKSSPQTPTLESETARIILENNFENDCVVTSLDYESLVKIKDAASQITTGYILPVALGSYYDLEDVDFFSLESTFITEQVILQAHLRGKTVSAWTVDRDEDLKRMIKIGVDDLITDDPTSARKTIEDSDNIETFLKAMCSLIRTIQLAVE